jgi:hypothetical protein
MCWFLITAATARPLQRSTAKNKEKIKASVKAGAGREI